MEATDGKGEARKAASPDTPQRAGTLDGMTILRFAHVFRNSGGGVEQYLHNLNSALLQRNRMTILQMYLAQEDEPCVIEREKIGHGELVWVPSCLRRYQCTDAKARLKNFLDKLLGREDDNPDLYRYEVNNDNVLEALDTMQIDLAAFHWISVDSEAVFRKTIQRQVPFVIVNHFTNERFRMKTVKKWARYSRLCGGVSQLEVPSYLKDKFVDVSDGIDTAFFNLDAADPVPRTGSAPVVLLPSRISPLKGHADVIEAVHLLKAAGIDATIVFAGREDSAAVVEELRSSIAKFGMDGDVVFLGQLSAAQLRDWYASSAVVVLPSYSEGLGRILLEAQAMEKPVIAYDTGGVSEAVRDGESGFLVSKGNCQALAERIGELLANCDRRREMGRSGKEFVRERFSLQSLAVRHERMYIEARALAEPAAAGE